MCVCRCFSDRLVATTSSRVPRVAGRRGIGAIRREFSTLEELFFGEGRRYRGDAGAKFFQRFVAASETFCEQSRAIPRSAKPRRSARFERIETLHARRLSRSPSKGVAPFSMFHREIIPSTAREAVQLSFRFVSRRVHTTQAWRIRSGRSVVFVLFLYSCNTHTARYTRVRSPSSLIVFGYPRCVYYNTCT